jgi:L-threonylcarbamoyladenylate synthase
MIIKKRFDAELIRILKHGGIGVLKTDTIYGLVGSALNSKTVARIYKLRHRHPGKPMIVLIGSVGDLRRFSIKINSKTKKILNKFWPGKISIILPCPYKKFSYLHRGAKTLAFRLPAKKTLLGLLKKTGPLVAPSVNPEALLPARSIREAQKYFGDKVDFYVDGGNAFGKPSALIEIKNDNIIVKRKGDALRWLIGPAQG